MLNDHLKDSFLFAAGNWGAVRVLENARTGVKRFRAPYLWLGIDIELDKHQAHHRR